MNSFSKIKFQIMPAGQSRKPHPRGRADRGIDDARGGRDG